MVVLDHMDQGNKPAQESSRQVRVLLVDDQIIIAEALRRLVGAESDIAFHAVQDPGAAVEAAVAWKPTVILQDLVMPGMDGFTLLRAFRTHPDTSRLPVVLLTSKEEPLVKAQGFAAGANDYLIKFPNRLELLARLRYHSSAYLSQSERDEAYRALHESERKLAEANRQLQKLAHLDGLTGLANRRRFDDVLAAEWQRAQRNRHTLSLLLCDVDHFKLYNDTHGHLAGDRCLQEVAKVLGTSLRRPADLATRYGGEEFALVLPETEADGAYAVAEACRTQVEALALPNQAEGPAAFITLSIGIAACIPRAGGNPADLIDLADRALYAAKDRGRNTAFHLS